MTSQTIYTTLTTPPVSETRTSFKLPAGSKYITGKTNQGPATPGQVHVSSYLSTRGPGATDTDPQGIPLLPAQTGITLEPSLGDDVIPMCLPIPEGYITLYVEICNPSGVTIIVTHVVRIRF